ncbi:type II toxin-antitoxin system PemK/MazF family toxin [Sphingoaurantiacus capsulatus]|uniref:Type II toxin-antitoxin system PemK/MazF family toxin n=1 Tax=Sphingoaurantiacus capsulatus TaxID=1771310 RepID=A0ABV7XF67_9SPHN
MTTAKRGDLITVALQGDLGKPRPAIVIQSDYLITHSVLVCPPTSTAVDEPLYRLPIVPTPGNGLRVESYVMVEKISAIPRWKVGEVLGRIDDAQLVALNRMLAEITGLFDDA